MCVTCGCGESEKSGHIHIDTDKTISLELDILDKNNRLARRNREFFRQREVAAFNLMSSPGAGKTTLLVKTLEKLMPRNHCLVIEGDQKTERDAERIRKTGAAAIQINTGAGCHLDARMVGHAVERFDYREGKKILFIENIGNLVCPAPFDLGEAKKIVLLSVTEGEDKPLKYPGIFLSADIIVINKTDLLPHLDFDLEECIGYIRSVAPGAEIITLSAKTGDNFNKWLDWIGQV